MGLSQIIRFVNDTNVMMTSMSNRTFMSCSNHGEYGTPRAWFQVVAPTTIMGLHVQAKMLVSPYISTV